MASRYLNNIKINDAYTFPSADGTDGQVITTDGAGTLSFADAAASDAIVLTVKNVSGGSLSAGTVVHPSPTASPPSGNVTEVIAADNSSAATMPAIGVLKNTLADDAEGDAIAFGRVSGLDTSSFSAGDPIFVDSSGGFTTTKPTGTALIQKIGIVVKSHASNGTIEVFGANRTNDVPNIAENYIWLGNSSGVATATEHLLNNVKDITTSSPTDGQVLTWDNANSYWKNADASGGGGTVTVEKNTFTATASQEDFTITSAADSVNNLQVYLDGVYQAKSNYTTSGTTVTINTGAGVAVGTQVEIIHLKVVNARIELNAYTGDGSDRTFSTQSNIDSENNVQVYIDGVYQSKDTYDISGTTVTFNTGNAPPNGTAVELLHIVATSSESALANYNVSVISANTNAQKDYLYVLTATCTLTLPSAPSTGDSIKISNRSGVATATVARNGKKIMGAAEDLTLDKLNSGFEMIFSGDAQGWILIGVEGTT